MPESIKARSKYFHICSDTITGRPCGTVSVPTTNISSGVYGVYEDVVPYSCITGWQFHEGRVTKTAYCNHTGLWERPEDSCSSRLLYKPFFSMEKMSKFLSKFH